MVKKRIVLSLLLLAVVHSGIGAAPKHPPREFFGLQLGMSEEVVHRLMRRIANPDTEGKESEQGGEREVWILKRDSRFRYLLTQFDKDQRLSWLTVVAHPRRVRYSNLASLKLATRATDGTNYSYTWKVNAGKQQPALVIIARGSNPEFLTSYSVYHAR